MANPVRVIEVDTDYIRGLVTRLEGVTDSVMAAWNFAKQANRHRNWSLREKQRLEASVNDLRDNTRQVADSLIFLRGALTDAANEFDNGQNTTLNQMNNRHV